jgi:hypothetical protein
MLSRMLSVLIAGCFRKLESMTAISDWEKLCHGFDISGRRLDEELG